MVALNVLVYSGPGIGPNAHAYLLRTLRQFLSHRYAVIPVDPDTLRTEPWESKAAMLVVPGGRDLPYVAAMNGEINARIRRWVSNGGRYLGFCAGGYYGSARCEFEPNTPMQVIGDRELALFNGTCVGCAYPGYHYKTEDGARAAEVSVDQLKFNMPSGYWRNDPSKVRVYYNGGGYFLTDSFLGKPVIDDSVQVLARYAPDVTDPYDRSKRVTDAPAIVSCKVGRGHAILTGLHPEYAWDFLASSNYTMPHNRHLIAHLRAHDAFRRRLMGAILAHLRLDIDQDALVDSPSADGHSIRLPTRSPTFLAPARVQGIAAAAAPFYAINTAATDKSSIAGGHTDSVIHDALEDIHVISAIPGAGNRRVPRDYQTAILKPTSLGPVSATNDENSEPSAKEPQRDHSVLVLCTPDSVPDARETPRFDMQLAIKYMQANKAHTAGSWLMYSDTTTSTQTFLEKNTKLQSILPNGTVNVATVQLAGRGRGRNAWIAPLGCLQFTMLLRHPSSSKQAPVVLLQYLISLAIVESVKSQPGYENIPLRLKWPNDLYAKHESLVDSDASDNPDSNSNPEFVKIGGVLVGSSYKNGEFSLLFGCGVNVANPLPTTSFNKLIREYNDTHGTHLATIPVELALARITAKFEEFYRKFLVSGFEPFLELYYKNWLHTDQIVTLVDQGYERVRIVGVSPETGLLLTRSIHNPNAHYSLQPDGNSFDMLQGMISRKT